MNSSGATNINHEIANVLSLSTSDNIWQAIEEENVYTAYNRFSSFSRWPMRMAKNITSFEDAYLLESVILDNDIDFAEGSVLIVVPTPQGKPERVFQVSNDLELSTPRSYFFPDFYNIQKSTRYIFQATPLTPELHEETRESIPITITPLIVLKANDENLTEDLETSVKLAEESYSTLKGICVDVEYDPEIADWQTIQFTFAVSGDIESILKEEVLFKQHLRLNVNPHVCELISVTYKWKE